MRVALCLFGLVGGKIGKNGKGENLDPAIAYKKYKEFIIDKNDQVDVFIHSWSKEEEEKLLKLYNPRGYIIEKQKAFKQSIQHPDILQFKKKKRNILKKVFLPKAYRDAIEEKGKGAYRAYSRWYSSMKVVELKKEYEVNNIFTYDCVMVSRLDVVFFTELKFDQYDLDYFYASHWNDAGNKKNSYVANRENHYVGKGFLDLWFFSNSKIMDRFGGLYNKLENYDRSPHIAARQHIDTITDKIRYTLYRWDDHEIIRRKIFEAEE